MKRYISIGLRCTWILVVEVLWIFDILLAYGFFPLSHLYKNFVEPSKNFGFFESLGLTFVLGLILLGSGVFIVLIRERFSRK